MIDLTAQLDALTGAALSALDRGEAVQIGQVTIVRRGAATQAQRPNGNAFASWSDSDFGRWRVLREAIFAAMGDGS